MTQQKRNVWIDVERLVASVSILFFHYPPSLPVRLVSGGLLVEFFFMLSGYFAFSHIERKAQEVASPHGLVFSYMRRFYSRVFPYVLASTLIAYATLLLSVGFTRRVVFIPLEILLLQCTGVYPSSVYVLWYLSITILCLPIAMYLRVYSGRFWNLITVLGPSACYVYLIARLGTLRTNDVSLALWCRALGGFLIGGLIRSLSCALARRDVTDVQRRAFSLVELGALLAAYVLMMLPSLDKTCFDVLVSGLFACSLAVSLSGKTWTQGLSSELLERWAGKLSLAIYCVHMPVFNLMKLLVDYQRHWDLWVLCGTGCTMAVSVGLVSLLNNKEQRRERDAG